MHILLLGMKVTCPLSTVTGDEYFIVKLNILVALHKCKVYGKSNFNFRLELKNKIIFFLNRKIKGIHTA